VLDKMHRRWERKIDIYMGRDAAAARSWGVRSVRIRW
jgi:3D (Asp-Asp-Asp) domain-containing protein